MFIFLSAFLLYGIASTLNVSGPSPTYTFGNGAAPRAVCRLHRYRTGTGIIHSADHRGYVDSFRIQGVLQIRIQKLCTFCQLTDTFFVDLFIQVSFEKNTSTGRKSTDNQNTRQYYAPDGSESYFLLSVLLFFTHFHSKSSADIWPF